MSKPITYQSAKVNANALKLTKEVAAMLPPHTKEDIFGNLENYATWVTTEARQTPLEVNTHKEASRFLGMRFSYNSLGHITNYGTVATPEYDAFIEKMEKPLKAGFQD